jgi:hypothetical protein
LGSYSWFPGSAFSFFYQFIFNRLIFKKFWTLQIHNYVAGSTVESKSKQLNLNDGSTIVVPRGICGWLGTTRDHTLPREGLSLGRTGRQLETTRDRTLPREGLSLGRTGRRLGTARDRTLPREGLSLGRTGRISARPDLRQV